MKKLLIALFLSTISDAQTVQQSIDQLGQSNNWVLAFRWTASGAGTVPVTASKLGNCCQGYLITQVETVPGTPAPTAGYNVAITDAGGVDVLAGAAASLSSTAGQSFAAASSATPVQGSFNLVITGQSVASATGVVYVFLSKPGTVNTAHLGSGSISSSPNWLTIANAPFVDARRYNFSPQSPGGSLIAGSNTIILSPFPAGVNTAGTGQYVYISGGTGTAEPCHITGGSGVWGAARGTLTIVCAFTHSGAWTVRSVLSGLQESMNVSCQLGGGYVAFEAGTFNIRGTSTVPCNGIGIRGENGGSNYTTIFSRTGNFGDSIALNGMADFQFENIKMTQVINYDPAGGGSIVNKPTSGAHLHLYACNNCLIQHSRFENMPANVEITGGVQITFRDIQWIGLWDRSSASLEVTSNSVLIDEDVSSGIPTFVTFDNNVFYGYISAAAGQHNVGPNHMIQINAVEDFTLSNSSIGGANSSNVYVHPLSQGPICGNIRIHDNKFDSSWDAEIIVENDDVQSASDVKISNNIFDGELQTFNSIQIINHGAGVTPVVGIFIDNNDIFGYMKSGISLLDGSGLHVEGNHIRGYNTSNFGSTSDDSGVYLGGRANNYIISNNMVGGDLSYGAYTAGCCTKHGVQIQAPTGANANGRLWGNYPPVYNALGDLTDPVYQTTALSFPGQTLHIGPGVSVSGATAIGCVNDANTANVPCEYRGLSHNFMIGPLINPAMPTSCAGAATGTLWNNSAVVNVCP